MEIKRNWTGTNWFIEGDIKGCFDNIHHAKLLEVMGRSIKDERVHSPIKGYVEDWKYYETYSGTPQGGIISPLLANIMLHEMDEFMKEQLIPQYTRKKRQENPENRRLRSKSMGN